VSGDDDDAEFPPGPVEVPIDGTLDLHTFAPREIAAVVESYLEACRERGILRVRIIHGKGTGAQRASVQRTLERSNLVSGFCAAPESAGGWGATLVDLLAP
jgi:DNA-nicking Smr family endonuclease